MARGKNNPPAIWRERLAENRVKKAAEVAALKLEGLRATRQQHQQTVEVVDAEIARLEAVANSNPAE